MKKRTREEEQKGLRKTEKPLTLVDGVLPQSGHVLQPCASLSLSLSLSSYRAFLLFLFAATNLRNGRFVAAIAAAPSRPLGENARSVNGEIKYLDKTRRRAACHRGCVGFCPLKVALRILASPLCDTGRTSQRCNRGKSRGSIERRFATSNVT